MITTRNDENNVIADTPGEEFSLSQIFKRRKMESIVIQHSSKVVPQYPSNLSDARVQNNVANYQVSYIASLRQCIYPSHNQQGGSLRGGNGKLKHEAFNNSNFSLMCFGANVLEVLIYLK